MNTERDELIQIIWDEAVADRVKGGESPQHVPIVRPKVEAMADKILAAGYRNRHAGIMAQAFDEGQKSGMRHADRLVAAAKIGRPELPGPISPNPYRTTK